MIQIHFQHGIAFGLDANNRGTIHTGTGQDVQVYGSRQYTAVLMVGVVSAHFGTTGRAEQGDFTAVIHHSKEGGKYIYHSIRTFFLGLNFIRTAAINMSKSLVAGCTV